MADLIRREDVLDFPHEGTSGTEETIYDIIHQYISDDIADEYEEELRTICWKMIEGMQNVIKTSPAVDAVPVVRCKDCKYSRMYCFGCSDEPVLACCEIEEDDDGYEFIRAASSVDPEGFCSEGERP